MANDSEEILYKVWASDNMVYGPVNLDILLDWVADGRVTPDTWVFAEGINSWKPAKTLPALGEALAEYHASTAPLPTAVELGQAEGAITVEDLGNSTPWPSSVKRSWSNSSATAASWRSRRAASS